MGQKDNVIITIADDGIRIGEDDLPFILIDYTVLIRLVQLIVVARVSAYHR